MSYPSSSNCAKPTLRKNSTPKGLVSSFGFTMPAEIKKKMRPQSISFGMSDNYEQKTIPKPDENITKTPITDTVFSNNNLVTRLIPPTTQIPLKRDIKRISQPEFSIRETYNSNRSGSKLTSIKRMSVQLPRLEVNQSSNSSISQHKNIKQTNNNRQVYKSFSNRSRPESDSYSRCYERENTVNTEKSIEQDTEVFHRKDTESCEYGYGEALAVEECTEIKDKLHAIDIAFDNTGMSVPLRNVLINVDDSNFEILAAMSTSTRIEDETFPVDELFNLTDSEPEPDEPDEPACWKMELPMNSPPYSPVPVYFEEDYFDQPGLTFNMNNHQTYDNEYNGSVGSLDSGDYILQPRKHSSENVNMENVVIDDECISDLCMSSINYNRMYNIVNQEILSESSESGDIHDDA